MKIFNDIFDKIFALFLAIAFVVLLLITAFYAGRCYGQIERTTEYEIERLTEDADNEISK